ncbi:hypothetical protein [Leptolyngbya sp. 7M]|uniref:hypothetical protein n=1 Tax=Leptolyngbya sp. 7M TaxID=2812896 RepID=UPI001B8D5B67|nr:hypothetical protein [Leptolyngbya sp. 7M]QYO67555.1 hypothetical protein JVX88_12615 [Leptolyngbya sp. 7M]
MLSALLELGKAYALLDPIATTTEADEPLNFFLDTLWQNQNEAAIVKGTAELKNFLEESASLSSFEEPLQLLKFQKQLLKAVGSGVELQQEKQDVRFLNALMNLGSAYADLNPDETIAGAESLNFFLDTLGNAQDEVEIQQGIGEFTTFFAGLDNFDRSIGWLEDGYKLLNSIKQANLSQSEFNLPQWQVGPQDDPFRYQSPVLSAFAQLFPNRIDTAGYQLLCHWLYGKGEPVYISNNPFWTDYMTRENQYTNPAGERQPFLPTVRERVMELAMIHASNSISAISDTIRPLNLANGFAPIGYMYLHGVAPELRIFGTAVKEQYSEIDPENNFKVTLNLSFTWVDDIDPNSQYGFKEWFASQVVGRALAAIDSGPALDRGQPVPPTINPQDYHIEIQWTSEIIYEKRGGVEAFYGWPFTTNEGFTPL